MKKRRLHQKEVMMDLSNRTVILILILVVLVSIISLGIYIVIIQEVQNQEAPPAMVVDLSQEPTLNQNQPASIKT